MGNICVRGARKASELTTHTISVKTGDKKGAEANGKIFLSMADGALRWSDELLMDGYFERDHIDEFYMEAPGLAKIKYIAIRRDDTHVDDAWYLEKLEITHKDTGSRGVFPVTRWINVNDRLLLDEFDSSLPADDKHLEQRVQELEKKRAEYQFVENQPGLPKQILSLPEDDKFTQQYFSDMQSRRKKLFAKAALVTLTTQRFKKLDDYKELYKAHLYPIPSGLENWRSDVEFGNQRLSGCNPVVLELCKKIPEDFAVTSEMISPFLEGNTVAEVIQQKKLYMVDLTYLATIECAENRPLCGPYGLFYSNNRGDLLPIAIQLMPTPATDNPVFLPSDPEYTWLTAKMWFNLSDSSHHQSATHLGLTHLAMETIVICAHRQLSVSHPIFRLLAPHFLYLLAINKLAVGSLVSPGGWVDLTMQIGRVGMFSIIAKSWAEWDLMNQGHFVNDMKRRGVDDTEALPNYHYRDDALLIWNAIRKYVSHVVKSVYDKPAKLSADYEIQGWLKEMVNVGVKGVPTSTTSIGEITELITTLIFMCSVQHATSFSQYEQYGFPPNYPSVLHGERPKNKAPLDEKAILESLPDKKHSLSVMIVTKLISQKDTHELSNFEIQYAHDPASLEALEGFKAELKEISVTIDARDANREKKYPYLNPRDVPNSIGI